jgi:hypothetical protein
MLHWRSNQKTSDTVQRDIERARAVLPMLRLKLDKEGAAAARVSGEGVVEVARALAHALGVPFDAALQCRSLDADQLVAAIRDLEAAQECCREYANGTNAAARELATKLTFGCEILTHLYRLRLHASSAVDPARKEIEALAEIYANLTRVLSDVAQRPDQEQGDRVPAP